MLSRTRLLSIPAIIIAIVCHEYAHAYMAYRLGDPTAKNAGRLSLNPIKHLDVFGLLSMIIFRFGWAKGVPIDSRYFKNRKLGTILVSLAGVFTNFVLAFISYQLIKWIAANNYNQLLIDFLFSLVWFNIMLGVFNLLPFPPLDGSKVVASLLPNRLEYFFYKYENYFSIILVFLIISGNIGKILTPIINAIARFMLSV
ncbi:MAG: site-2 protease family protein [Tissierellia bacterium]|nr:site-2 protease family protein [Tissierellia bacterium]